MPSIAFVQIEAGLRQPVDGPPGVDPAAPALARLRQRQSGSPAGPARTAAGRRTVTSASSQRPEADGGRRRRPGHAGQPGQQRGPSPGGPPAGRTRALRLRLPTELREQVRRASGMPRRAREQAGCNAASPHCRLAPTRRWAWDDLQTLERSHAHEFVGVHLACTAWLQRRHQWAAAAGRRLAGPECRTRWLAAFAHAAGQATPPAALISSWALLHDCARRCLAQRAWPRPSSASCWAVMARVCCQALLPPAGSPPTGGHA